MGKMIFLLWNRTREEEKASRHCVKMAVKNWLPLLPKTIPERIQSIVKRVATTDEEVVFT